MDDWKLATCVLDDALLDDKVDNPVFDSWELDHVLLVDDGPEELNNRVDEEVVVGKFPDDEVLGDWEMESIVLEELNDN